MKGLGTSCKQCVAASVTCNSDYYWGDPVCTSYTNTARGTACTSTKYAGEYIKSCDGSGNCVGWTGTGKTNCPFGYSSSSKDQIAFVCDIPSTNKYRYVFVCPTTSSDMELVGGCGEWDSNYYQSKIYTGQYVPAMGNVCISSWWVFCGESEYRDFTWYIKPA